MSDDILKTAAVGAATYLGGPIGGLVAGSLLASESPSRLSSGIPAPPIAELPGTMPTPNNTDVLRAKKKSISAMRARKGRASTILTADTAISDALGG